MQIPVDLIEQIERNNVVLIVGHDINVGEPDEAGLPSLSDLARELAARSNYQDQDLNLARVAQHYELEFGRHALISYVKDRFQAGTTKPVESHRILTRLPFRVVITTCLNDWLERALYEAERQFVPIIRNADVAYEDEQKLLVVKMYGDLGQPDTVVLTDMEHRRFLSEVTTISDVLNRLIASRTLLLLGYDLDDSDFKDLYDRVTRRIDRHTRRSYAFYQQATPYALSWWERLNNVQTIQAGPTTFLRQLEQELHERQRSRTQSRQPEGMPMHEGGATPKPIDVVPRRPYKFLNAYEEEDAVIFFGRDREKSQLLSKVVAYRLVLFYGKSGVGKTSLIQAGLIPMLRANGYHPVHTRILNNPQLTIPQAVNATLETPPREQPTLHAYLREACKVARGLIILCIDQFEELFTLVDSETRARFIKELIEIYADDQLPLKIVLSFREDFLAELNVFTADIPDIFHNYYRQERLTLAQAREAILNPASLCGITFESSLVDRLLSDLSGDKIDPPQLQIECDYLYDALDSGETLITHRHYELLGGASAILTNYLDQVLKQHTREQQLIIQRTLKAFLTSSDTKVILTIDTLAARSHLLVEQIQQVLNELLRARLIRRAESETQYELAHEYLVGRISSWMSDQEHAQRRAQEMLEQGLVKWKSFHLPLYRDEIAIVDAQRDILVIGEEAEALLVHSAVWSGHNAEYWVGRATPELAAAVLEDALQSDDVECRRRGAQLAQGFAVRQLREMLAHRMFNDAAPTVRREAALSLMHMDSAWLVQCLRGALAEGPAQAQRAMEAIDNVQSGGLVEVDSTRLGGIKLRWRLSKMRVQRHRYLWRTLTLYSTCGGLIGAALGGFLGTLLSSSGLVATLGMAASAVVGLLTGMGIGLGFGLITAMQEPRNSIMYVVGAMLGGGVMGAIAGMNTIYSLEAFLSAAGLGILGGGAGGGVVAIIMNSTARLTSAIYRSVVRSILALLAGALTSGATLALVIELNLGPPGVHPLYGFLTGMLSLLGIVIGLELAERQLHMQTRAA